MTLICPHCGGGGKGLVTDSRLRAGYLMRRRVCSECECRYSTAEVVGDGEKVLAAMRASESEPRPKPISPF